jgi:NAD(P)-dependent dehydrogenase (short-subunit alcohol dehydrogenase family)
MKHAPFSLAGKVALVTGAAGGIGRATVHEMHARGAIVVATDLHLDAVEQATHGLGERTLPLAADVTDRNAMDTTVEAAIDRFGKLDLVFANAGTAHPITIATAGAQEFERIVEVNLFGVSRTVQAALPHIIAARGHILVTASMHAFLNGVINSPYAMAKAGVEQFGRALRTELAIHGVTAGVLYPGWIDTEIIKAAYGGDLDATAIRRRGNPGWLGRPIAPERVAREACDGIERRAARTVVPKRWWPLLATRGVLNPISDGWVERDATMQRHLRAYEERATARNERR